MERGAVICNKVWMLFGLNKKLPSEIWHKYSRQRCKSELFQITGDFLEEQQLRIQNEPCDWCYRRQEENFLEESHPKPEWRLVVNRERGKHKEWHVSVVRKHRQDKCDSRNKNPWHWQGKQLLARSTLSHFGEMWFWAICVIKIMHWINRMKWVQCKGIEVYQASVPESTNISLKTAINISGCSIKQERYHPLTIIAAKERSTWNTRWCLIISLEENNVWRSLKLM